MDESLLIQQAQQGSLDAFNQLVMDYQDRVYRQSLYVLGNEHDAEDVSQETFITAYLKLSSFRGGSFIAWLLRIATNKCIDRLRFLKRCSTITLEPYHKDGEEMDTPQWLVDHRQTPEMIFERSEFYEGLQKALSRLPVQYRMVVVLIDLLELDYQETASILSVPLGAVKSRLSESRRCIGNLWSSWEDEKEPEIGSAID